MFTHTEKYSPGEIRVGYNFSPTSRILVLILSSQEGLIIENSTDIPYLHTDFPINRIVSFGIVRHCQIPTWPLLFPHHPRRAPPRPQKLK
jgi:hypothetical protein